jgi:hypothetical protein
MPASQARVATGRAGRYLTQLCQHTGQLSKLGHHALSRRHGNDDGDGGPAPLPRHTDMSGADGVIDFDGGRCTLHATGEGLELNAEAGDQQQLDRIQEAITGRLERIGRRDSLTVIWGPSR